MACSAWVGVGWVGQDYAGHALVVKDFWVVALDQVGRPSWLLR